MTANLERREEWCLGSDSSCVPALGELRSPSINMPLALHQGKAMSKEGRWSEGREDEKGSGFWQWRFQKASTALTKAKGKRMRLNSSHRAAVTGPGAVHSLDMKRCYGPLQ